MKGETMTAAISPSHGETSAKELKIMLHDGAEIVPGEDTR